jgi:16S rRNA (guanine966-N2)-methyltransferase
LTRVVAGRVGGRRIDVPKGRRTRPTSDRAREGLFSALGALRGALDGAFVLDLYAGSGALGLEAWSRGAAAVTFVESDAAAAAVIRANVEALGVDAASVRCDRVERFLAGSGTAFDVVFVDAPYADDVATVLGRLADPAAGWLARDAIVVVERSSRDDDFAWPDGLSTARELTYGEARLRLALWYGRES